MAPRGEQRPARHQQHGESELGLNLPYNAIKMCPEAPNSPKSQLSASFIPHNENGEKFKYLQL